MDSHKRPVVGFRLWPVGADVNSRTWPMSPRSLRPSRPATRTPRPSSFRSSTTSCGSWPPRAWPRSRRADAPADRPGPRGLPPAGRGQPTAQTGTAAGTSSPPRPRPCAASWSRPPGASRRPARRAGGTGSIWTRRPLVAPAADEDLLALDEALSRLAADDPAGRPGQAPLLRRPDRPRGGRRCSACRRGTADRLWAFARAWLAARDRRRTAWRRPFHKKSRPSLRDRQRLARTVLVRRRRLDARTRHLHRRPADGRPGRAGRATWTRPARATPALRGRVEALLAEHEQARASCWTAAPGVGANADTIDQPPAAQPGTVIGPYKLLEQIGEGGMGTVWLAEQTRAGPAQGRPEGHQGRGWTRGRCWPGSRPSGRPWPSWTTRTSPRCSTAGTTAAGRPYFVMELVKGVADHRRTATSTG